MFQPTEHKYKSYLQEVLSLHSLPLNHHSAWSSMMALCRIAFIKYFLKVCRVVGAINEHNFEFKEIHYTDPNFKSLQTVFCLYEAFFEKKLFILLLNCNIALFSSICLFEGHITVVSKLNCICFKAVFRTLSNI